MRSLAYCIAANLRSEMIFSNRADVKTCRLSSQPAANGPYDALTNITPPRMLSCSRRKDNAVARDLLSGPSRFVLAPLL